MSATRGILRHLVLHKPREVLATACSCLRSHTFVRTCSSRLHLTLFSVTDITSVCFLLKSWQKPSFVVVMLSQQLALQCPSHPHLCRRTACKVLQHPSALPTVSYTVVSSSGAEIAKRRVAPTTRHVVESFSARHPTPAPRETDPASKFLEVYILGKHIGSGAYGQVQLVVERASGQCAAVKLLPKTRGKLSKVFTYKAWGFLILCGQMCKLAALTDFQTACSWQTTIVSSL